MPPLDLPHILKLAEQGRGEEARALIEPAALAGDPTALYACGLWRIEGQHLPRDLALGRSLIAEAEAAGSLPAARVLSALLATGTGGASDWDGALAVLKRWRDRDPVAARQLDLVSAAEARAAPRPDQLSASPWITRFVGLFSADECTFLVEVAQRRFKPALVFDDRQKKFVAHGYRDAQAAGFPAVFEWPLVHLLNRRIAAASGTDVAQGEPLQILRYAPGQSYREHMDAVPGLPNQRILTMLVALNDGFEGGATDFPDAGLALTGKVGDGLLFCNIDEQGRPDRRARHAGLSVSSGTKLIASRWIRQNPPPPGEAFGRHEVEGEA